jgi:hypothetical protein
MPAPWTPESALAKAVYAAGFDYEPDQDIIYSRMEPLQRKFGYAYGYDAAALGMSADIDCEPIFFDYDGKHWMIELWKGQYGLETGCEVGVYTRGINSTSAAYTLLDATVGRRPGDSVPSHNLYYDCASDEDMLELSATLNRNGKALFKRGPEKHWWLTGFKWGVFSEPKELSVDVAITLKDEPMCQAFQAAIEGRPYPNLEVEGTTVSFTFDQPYAVPQPPKPPALLEKVRTADRAIVAAYDAFEFPDNDPNKVEAEFLRVAGLSLLHMVDWFGTAVSQLAIDIGIEIGAVVSGLMEAFGVPAGSVEGWLGAIEQDFSAWVSGIVEYLGLSMDDSSYVEIDNTNGATDLVLAGQTATSGTYVVAPPEWIPSGTVARLVLRDPKLSWSGSAGNVTYEYGDAKLTVKTVVFSFECPYFRGEPNKAWSSQAEWVCWGKSGSASGSWSTSIPHDGHPLYVGYVCGPGEPH